MLSNGNGKSQFWIHCSWNVCFAYFVLWHLGLTWICCFFQTCDSFSWKKMWFHFWKPWKNYFLTISTVFVLLCNLRLRDVIRAQFCDRISWGKTQDKTWHFGGKSGVCKLDFSNVFSIVKEQDKQKNMLTHCIWWKHINLEQKECFAIKWAINSRNLFDKCSFFFLSQSFTK